jgi:hypothetical protein
LYSKSFSFSCKDCYFSYLHKIDTFHLAALCVRFYNITKNPEQAVHLEIPRQRSRKHILGAVKDSRTPEFRQGMAQIAPFQEYEHEASPPAEDDGDDADNSSEEEGNQEQMANLQRPGNEEPGELPENLDDDEDHALRQRVRDILGPDKFEQLLDSLYLMARAESLRDAVEQEAVENYIEQHLQQLFEVIINHQLEYRLIIGNLSLI